MEKRTAALLAGLGVMAAVLYAVGRKPLTKIGSFVFGALDGAKRAGVAYNLPSWLFLTAGAHESGMGLSQLARNANNFFGFTADSPTDPWNVAGKATISMPTTEWKNGIPYKTSRKFRAYATPYDSFMDYGRLLTTAPRYAAAVAAARSGDIRGTFAALGRSGYATDPGYGDKLASVYNTIKGAIA